MSFRTERVGWVQGRTRHSAALGFVPLLNLSRLNGLDIFRVAIKYAWIAPL